jgi:hypothetical protein
MPITARLPSSSTAAGSTRSTCSPGRWFPGRNSGRPQAPSTAIICAVGPRTASSSSPSRTSTKASWRSSSSAGERADVAATLKLVTAGTLPTPSARVRLVWQANDAPPSICHIRPGPTPAPQLSPEADAKLRAGEVAGFPVSTERYFSHKPPSRSQDGRNGVVSQPAIRGEFASRPAPQLVIGVEHGG